jgi:integral membrane protein
MKENKLLQLFKIVAIAEGVSFLVLLLIAMPLKYIAHNPKPVRIVGMAHGILFITFLVLSFEVGGRLKKKFGWFVKAFIAAIIPFGAFVFERQFQKEMVAEQIN